MNNFEKRKFLDYLEKLLPYTDTNDYNFDRKSVKIILTFVRKNVYRC